MKHGECWCTDTPLPLSLTDFKGSSLIMLNVHPVIVLVIISIVFVCWLPEGPMYFSSRFQEHIWL